ELHDLEELLARVREVLAERRLHRAPDLGELAVDDARDQRHAAAAPGAGARACLHLRDRRETARADRVADRAARDVVARADLRAVVEPEGDGALAAARPDEQIERPLGDGQAAPADVEERRVGARVADQHAAEEARTVGREHELLIDAADTVLDDEAL